MKILFDQGTPEPLRHLLTQHEIATAYERGWAQLKNGELLTPAESSAPAYRNCRSFHAQLAADSACERFGGPGD